MSHHTDTPHQDAPAASTHNYGQRRRVAGRWADIGLQAGVQLHPGGDIEPFVELYEHDQHGMRCLFDGPLSCEQSLELATALISAVSEARAQAEGVGR